MRIRPSPRRHPVSAPCAHVFNTCYIRADSPYRRLNSRRHPQRRLPPATDASLDPAWGPANQPEGLQEEGGAMRWTGSAASGRWPCRRAFWATPSGRFSSTWLLHRLGSSVVARSQDRFSVAVTAGFMTLSFSFGRPRLNVGCFRLPRPGVPMVRYSFDASAQQENYV